jgi:prefoldin subunit 5
MNLEVSNLQNELHKLSEKYPNITNIWNIYIEQKVNSLKQTIDECTHVIDVLKTSQYEDFSEKLIATLYLINNNTT